MLSGCLQVTWTQQPNLKEKEQTAMNSQDSINQNVKVIGVGADGKTTKEQSGNPRPANWPAPPQDKIDRITQGVPVPQAKPKP